MLLGGEHPKFLIFLILAPLFWGGNFVVAGVMANDLPGHWTNFLRWLIALVVLAPFCVPAVWRHRTVLLCHWKRLTITALLGVTLFNTVLYIALQTASISTAAVAFAVTPFLISGLQALLHRELPSARLIGGAAIALAGMALAQWEALNSGMPLLGVALVLMAALIWSGFCVALKYCAVPVPCHASFFCQIAIGTSLMVPFLAFTSPLDIEAITGEEWLGLAYLGIFAAAVAFWFWQRAIIAVGPARSSVFMNLVPVSSVVFGVIFLGIPITGFKLAAFVMVACGIYLSTTLTAPLRLPDRESKPKSNIRVKAVGEI